MKISLSFLPRLWANWITLLGTIITTIAALATILFLGMELTAGDSNPYAASLLVAVLPAAFIFGLLLIPVGLWFDRRKKKAAPTPDEDALASAIQMAIHDDKARFRIFFFAVATALNIILIGAVGQHVMHYMDSPKFCGTTCHTVMQPEWTAYNASPHSRVACVQCHIGPGAKWLVKAKINGLSQVVGVMTGKYHTPIPQPVQHLRPSRDTCEQCHWPEKFAGNKLQVFAHFKQDKDNTPAYNAMLLRIGGRNPKTKKYEGIHWHVGATAQVKYQYTDEKRQKIGKITVYENDKVTAEYSAGKNTGAVVGERTMDCVDCHNRPTHVFDQAPHLAVDRLIAAGSLDAKVPWIAKVASDVLSLQGIPREEPAPALRKALDEAYSKDYADVKPAPEKLDEIARTLADAYKYNNFPAMKVTFGTYRTNIGHQSDDPNENVGCFRCHDTDHEKKLPDGTTQALGQDCETCHEPLAQDEDPAKFDDSLKALLKTKSAE